MQHTVRYTRYSIKNAKNILALKKPFFKHLNTGLNAFKNRHLHRLGVWEIKFVYIAGKILKIFAVIIET